MNDAPTPDAIAELASRLLDRDIEFADVPAESRALVQARVETYKAMRDVVGRLDAVETHTIDAVVRAAMTSEASGASRSNGRSRTPWVAAAAAAITLVVALGIVSLTRSGDDDRLADSSLVAVTSVAEPSAVAAVAAAPENKAAGQAPVVANDSAPAASTDAVPADATVIADMVALGDLVAVWSTTPPLFSDAEPVCAITDGRSLVAGTFVFAGQPAEVHFAPRVGAVVFSLPDCTKMASIVR